MSARRKRPGQLKLPGTKRTVAVAKNEWRAALAAVEEAEADAEEKAELAKEAKELVAQLQEALRIAQLVMREAMDEADGRQEALPP